MAHPTGPPSSLAATARDDGDLWTLDGEGPESFRTDDPSAAKRLTLSETGSGPTVTTADGPRHVRAWVGGHEASVQVIPEGVDLFDRVRGVFETDVLAGKRVIVAAHGNSLRALVMELEGLTPDEIMALSDSEEARGVAVRGNQSMWMMINNTLAPFDNVKVRQAINHAINREAIIKDIYHGMMNNWQGVMPSTYPGYEPWLKYDFDPAKAKQILADAGYPNGFDAELSFCVCDAAQESIAILLQSDFKKAGINLSLKKLPTAAWSDTVQSKQGSLALWTDMPIQPDINYALKLVWPTGALVNYHNFSDPKVDQTLKDGEGVVDPAARIAAHAGIQEHIHDQAPLGWIGEHYFAVGLSRKVSGFRWYTTQYYHVSEMSIAD